MDQREYTVRKFKLQSFELTDKYYAVLATHFPGQVEHELYYTPVQAIGLATITSSTYRAQPEGDPPRLLSTWEETRLVGLELEGGVLTIIDECSNFAGLAREGDDIYECQDSLEGSYRIKPGLSKIVVAGIS